MGHHFVPRHYLRFFEDPEHPGMAWVHPRCDDPRLASIKAIAQSSGFYDPDTEIELNRLVEAPAKPALQALREGAVVSSADRHRVALYVATMLYRVPHNRKRGESLAPAALAETVTELRDELQALQSEPSVSPERIQAWFSELDAAQRKFAKGLPAEVQRLVRSPWPGPTITNIIRRMTWRVLIASPPEAFATSDNPAFFFESMGLGNPEAELILPLSPMHCLHCSHSRAGDSGLVHLPAEREVVHEFNRRTATGVTSILIANARLGWPRKMLAGRKPSLNRIRWSKSAA